MHIITSLHEQNPLQKKTCVALGLFDGLHLGHRAVVGAAVEKAGAEGLSPAVFTFSMHGSQHPAAKPVSGRLFTPEIREGLLRGMGVELMLCPPFEEFRGMEPRKYVKAILHDTLRAAWVYCGENYHFGKEAAGNVADLRALCAGFGIRVETVPLVYLDGEPVSSTRIRSRIAEGDMPMAAKLLGRPFAIDFEVIRGSRLGRTLDSPTINQPIPPWFAAPRFGVYATMTTVDGARRVSVTNVGYKPTVGSEQLLSETYIQGYDGDLYGRKILVEFLEFIRPERRFGSVRELREQIHRDSEAAFTIGGHSLLTGVLQ